jgi:hypothetical protein
MTMQSRRSGFALPMAILMIGFMTAGLVAAFTRIEAESRTVDHLTSELEAFALAQTGLDRALAAGKTTPALDTVDLPGGAAVVQITLVRAAANPTADTSLWLVRSTGRTTAHGAGRPSAVRTVAQIARRFPGSMHVVSAWTSLTGIRKNGESGVVSGVDAAGQEDALPGVAVPTFSGKTANVSGDPAIEIADTASLATSLKLDWNGIINASDPAVRPDYVVCNPATPGYSAAYGPCGAWPASMGSWPVTLINGTRELNPAQSGSGTLIVTGNLILNGSFQWNGIILVGGKITSDGYNSVHGAVVSGLNWMMPTPPAGTLEESAIGNGNKNFRYHSTNVENAAAGLQRMQPLMNAWLDNWSGAGWTP